MAVLALALAAMGWLVAGCVSVAVNPFYLAADLVYDEGLQGSWKDKPDGNDSWTISRGEGKSYTIEIKSSEQRAVFQACLFKLGGDRFLDLYPSKSALEEDMQKNRYGAVLVPSHFLVRVRATQPALKMSCLSLEWLTSFLKQQPKAIAHVMLPDGRVLMTAETPALQAFVKQHVNDSEAWNPMYDDGLVRLTTGTKAK